ncbi:uncharacterized protein [Pseudochaenichthys georgianus]|uniref:uncharacterized protein n=1 Tax=Pseudochaenichthys georgianus TaxID=52239 RepID=UPI00146B8BD1|nr:uncharacterized protein LOC117454349 [Pseudochaenichthys georgianus]
MSKDQMLLSLKKQEVTAASEEIFVLFEQTIAELEEELLLSKEENKRLEKELFLSKEENKRLQKLPKLPNAVSQAPLRIHREDGMASECPICKSSYRALSKHLQRNHNMRNADERRIILLMANGRTNIRLHPCIIAGCEYIGTRLDRHLDKDHVELSREEMHVVVNKVKIQVAKRDLRELRLTNPTVEIISSWDVDTVDDEVLSQSPPLSPEIECDNPDCNEWRMEANTMRAQRDRYAAEVKSLRCKLQQRIKHKRHRREQRAKDMHESDEEDGEEQEPVYLKKRPRRESTKERQSKS